MTGWMKNADALVRRAHESATFTMEPKVRRVADRGLQARFREPEPYVLVWSWQR